MLQDAISRLREYCQTLPETTEDFGVGAPSFKVRKKIYVMQHAHNDRPSLWCKAPAGIQDALVTAAPGRFFVPPYVGQHGWVGVYLDTEIDWDEIEGLIEESYRMTAPKRALARLDRERAAHANHGRETRAGEQ